MMIVSENLSDVPFAHCNHGNAIGETVLLIAASLVESKAAE
jgi:hypothetical protein